MSNARYSSVSVAQYAPIFRSPSTCSPWTLSASQMHPGRTASTSCRAAVQKSSGTLLATSQRKPSTISAHIFSVSI